MNTVSSQKRALRRLVAVTPNVWQHLHDAVVARAESENLVDVAYARHDTPLGPLLLGATSLGLVRIGLPSESEDEVLDELARRVSPRVLFASHADLTRARTQLDEYFEGRRHAFDLRLDVRLSRGFRREILRATSAIPYGQTVSYQEVATAAGNSAAGRAAGGALANNPLPIVVPCHRVRHADGTIGGYRGGLAAKTWLLALEGAHPVS
jgi:methylated-DNA-[protein]-cysteine S-methyltransferase